MENILFVIIAIIWIVSSIYKAKNKNTAPPKPQESQQGEEEPDFVSTLEEMILGKKIEVPQPKETSLDEHFDEEDFTTNTNQEEDSSFSDFEGRVKHDFSNNVEKLEDSQLDYSKGQDKVLTVIDTEEAHDDIDDTISIAGEEFDPRKAVIFSEVLKRPQY